MRIQTDTYGLPNKVLFEPTARDEERALKNHCQTLARLNERLGVSWCELAAIVCDRPWHEQTEEKAIEEIELEFFRRAEPSRRVDRLMEFVAAHQEKFK